MAERTNDPALNDDALDALFAQARADAPRMPDRLQARILADAQAVQDSAVQAGPVRTASPERVGLLQRISAAVGGWPALGGMITASVLGLWIGAAPPAFLPDAAQYLDQTAQEVDVFDSYEYAVAWAEDG